MRKIITQILIFVIMFNFIFSAYPIKVKAIPSTTHPDFEYTEETYKEGESDGTTTNPSGGKSNLDYSNTQSTTSANMGSVAAMFCGPALMASQLLNLIIRSAGYIGYATGMEKWPTIQGFVFGNYHIVNANMFKDSDDLDVRDHDNHSMVSNHGVVYTINQLKEATSEWYYILRLISLVLGLLTLIYIGIRMALSTIASDQAKYKKMLVAWVQSIGIIVILPYIMRGLNYLSEVLLSLAIVIRDALNASGQEGFEFVITDFIFGKIQASGGNEFVAYTITYALLVWTQFKFFLMYLKRFFAVAFLTIISPLITITYSIDKAGDGKAQAFTAWLKEYATNMLIQPLQAYIYLVFTFSASAIAEVAPIIGVIFLMSLTRAEKIIKTVFDLRGLSSISTMKLFKKGK